MAAADKPIVQFADQAEFVAWLAENHTDHPGIWMKISKRRADVATVSYPDAVDAALAFGWIDGQKRASDGEYYLQGFTQRRPRSVWSKRNVERVAELIAEGAMQPSGLAQVEAAKADGRWERAYSGSPGARPSPEFLAALEKNPRALAFYETLNAVNRYALYFRIQTAKREATRARRIEAFVEMLARGETFH